MKQSLNHANPLAMLLMALAMAFAISCESEEEKQAKAERAARTAAAAEKVAARAEAARAEAKSMAKVEAEEAKVKNGSSLNSIIKELRAFNNKDASFPVIGSYANSGFKFTLPEKPNDKYLQSVNELFPNANKISDRNANIFSFAEIHGLDNNSSIAAVFQQGSIIIEETEGSKSADKYYVSFYYADRDVIIQFNESGKVNVSLDLKKGWNKAYTHVDIMSGYMSSENFTSQHEIEWRLLYEAKGKAKGDVSIKLPEADSDQLRQAVHCISIFDFGSLVDDLGYHEGFHNLVYSYLPWENQLKYRESFRFLYKQAYDQREKDLDGWLQRYIKLIVSLIPETYESRNWDTMVSRLLAAYEDLMTNPGAFSQIYELMSNRQWEHSSYAYDEILAFAGDKQPEAFLNEYGVNKQDLIWAYSFWGRRYHENPNNIEPIAAILRMFRDGLLASAS
jgi:hypothetical protein